MTGSARLVIRLLLLGVVASIGTPAQAQTLWRSDEPGQYNVGTTTFSANMTG
jgi:hypothetical protein